MQIVSIEFKLRSPDRQELQRFAERSDPMFEESEHGRSSHMLVSGKKGSTVWLVRGAQS